MEGEIFTTSMKVCKEGSKACKERGESSQEGNQLLLDIATLSETLSDKADKLNKSLPQGLFDACEGGSIGSGGSKASNDSPGLVASMEEKLLFSTPARYFKGSSDESHSKEHGGGD